MHRQRLYSSTTTRWARPTKTTGAWTTCRSRRSTARRKPGYVDPRRTGQRPGQAPRAGLAPQGSNLNHAVTRAVSAAGENRSCDEDAPARQRQPDRGENHNPPVHPLEPRHQPADRGGLPPAGGSTQPRAQGADPRRDDTAAQEHRAGRERPAGRVAGVAGTGQQEAAARKPEHREAAQVMREALGN